MDGGGVSQLHGVLSSYMKAHFVARLPAARGNWGKISCGAAKACTPVVMWSARLAIIYRLQQQNALLPVSQ